MMRTPLTRAAVLLVLILPRIAAATPYTFTEAARIAESAAPATAAARARTEVTRRGEDVAGMLPNPNVVIGSYTETSRLYAAFSMPLPIWGQIGLARDAARMRTDEAIASERTTRLDATLAALSSWVDVWLAHSTLRAAEENRARLDALARAIDELVDAGRRPRMDALSARAEFEAARSDEETARRSLVAARVQFAARLGIVARTDADLPDVAGEPPAIAASPQADLSRAGSHPPAVEVLDARARAAAADVRFEERARIPTPTLLFGSYLFRATNPPTDFFVGLGFELPIFNQRGPLIAAAHAREAAARAESDALAMQLRADARSAAEQLEAARSRAETMNHIVLPAANEAADLAQESYRAGRLDLAGLLAAEQRRLAARVRADQSVAERTRAWIALARATGVTR
jgi:cobalt-zinc-cadmium efflux system outer membrane protein